MPETYNVSLGIQVKKETTEDVIVSEEYYFTSIPFSKMANVADEFYELITKLQKIK